MERALSWQAAGMALSTQWPPFLAGTQTCLGVLPLGTLNHFAKDMKIPLTLEAAAEVIVLGKPSLADVGEVNGRVFLNNSSLGLYPRLVREREQLQSAGSGKWTAFARAAGTLLRQYSQVTVGLETRQGVQLSQKTPFIFIGNNQYRMAGWSIGSRDCLDSGKLMALSGAQRQPCRFAAAWHRDASGAGQPG